jgi:hypothetical protein
LDLNISNIITVEKNNDNKDDNNDYGFYLPLGGGLVKLKGKGKPGDGPPGGPRGLITGLSKASRKRLLQTMGSVDRGTRPPLFIGLTYPGDAWPDDPAEWHADLDAWWQRLQRFLPGRKLAMIWRLEPQERGAPHFHLLIFGAEFIPYRWVADNWSAVVGGDERHRRSCSRVERVKSWRGAMSYASKYLGKLSDGRAFRANTGDVVAAVGRHWGIKGRANLPITWVRYMVHFRTFYRLRRTIAAYMRSKGRQHRVRGRFQGVWCFLDAHEGLRLVGLYEPDAEMTFQAPKL